MSDADSRAPQPGAGQTRETAGECAFCGIASGTLPRQILRQDDELIAFRNALEWAPVMYLVAPVEHMSQKEFWRSPLFSRAAQLAVELGESDAPNGFRIVSNFGADAMQSQPHGHLHVIGGAHLGLYMDFDGKSEFLLRLYGGEQRDSLTFRRRHP